MQPSFTYRKPCVDASKKRWCSDLATRRIVSEILSIPNTGDWNITDQSENLVIVHFDQNADIKEWGWLKGYVLDVARKIVISRSPGFVAHGAINSELTPDSGKISLTELNGHEHRLPVDSLIINPLFEGPVLHITKIDGRVLHFTGKNLRAGKLTIPGSPKNLKAIATDLGLPEDDEFFDPAKLHSPYTYSFIVAHPDLLSSSKLDVGPGILVYLGYTKSWEPTKTVGINAAEAEEAPQLLDDFPDNLYEDFISPGIYAPRNFTLEEANHFLRYGWQEDWIEQNSDPRLWTGEALVITTKEGQRFNVYSPAYAFRRSVRGEDPSLPARFHQLLDDAALSESEFQLKYPAFTDVDFAELARFTEINPISEWPNGKEMMSIGSYEDRVQVILVALLNSCYIGCQAKVLRLLEQYYQNCEYLQDKLQKSSLVYTGPKNSMQLIRHSCGKITTGPQNIRDILSRVACVQDAAKYLQQMSGTDVYRMAKYFRKAEADQEIDE